jgi:hypothetical protein
MAKKTYPPSIRQTAFECSHCGAFTTQYWFRIYAGQLEDDAPLPEIPDKEWLKEVQQDQKMSEKVKRELTDWFSQVTAGLVFLATKPDSAWCTLATNLHISKCYNCKKIAVWVHDTMVFPHERQGPQANQDLPSEIAKDFEEARSIVGLSPRGSAALLRLCIQKLCVLLGQKGKNIDDDIAALVKQGLNPLVQKALDIVRVIGNEAVHPGVIDLNDNRDIADQLFGLVNSIADQMITHPKNVSQLYEQLPFGKREAIEKRDGKS